MFRHILIDEMQDTNAVQVEVVEAIAAERGREPHGRRRRRPVDLPVPGRELRQYPQVPRAASRVATLSARRQLPVDAPDRRLHEGVDPAQPLGVSQGAGLGPRRRALPRGCRHGRRLRGGRPHLPADPRSPGQGVPLGQMAVLYRNHHDSILLQGELVTRGIPYTVRSGLRFFEQAHIKDVLAYLRIVQNPRDEASWRRMLLLLPGIGPAKAAAIFSSLASRPSPWPRSRRPRRWPLSRPRARDSSRGSSTT